MRYLFAAVIVFISSVALPNTFPHPMAVGSKGMVVTCQPLAADVGVNILQNGGNAADAYIATTLAEYVTAYGYTSLSGPLGLLYYDTASKNLHILMRVSTKSAILQVNSIHSTRFLAEPTSLVARA